MKTPSTNTVFLCYASLLFFITGAGILTISCDSFVEVDLPQSQLANPSVFENYATADATLTDIYAKMRDQGMLCGQSSGISNTLGNYSDEMDFYGSTDDPSRIFYNNTLLPATASVLEYWSVAYNQIYAANAVIEGCEASTSLTDKDKKSLVGEALFIRALLHFYLTNLYGQIPYITGTDYKKNSIAGKLTTDIVYTRVIADLEKASQLLDTDYSNDERTRPKAFTVKALLARVYLYQERWPEAANAASSVLNATELYTIQQKPSEVFLKDSKETIWQFKPALSGKNTDEAATFIFFTTPPPASALSQNLISSFEAGDLRKTSWTGSVTQGSTSWYYPFKYKEFENTASSMEYPIVFRLAEQYLIRAEARAQQGDLIDAKEDLNVIRKRSGLANTMALTKEQLLKAIANERRWEFFSEYGHRFFDLKRTGMINQTLSVMKPGWKTTDQLFPLPQTELNLNSNLLPQNDGY